jgi:hypothetical protein
MRPHYRHLSIARQKSVRSRPLRWLILTFTPWRQVHRCRHRFHIQIALQKSSYHSDTGFRLLDNAMIPEREKRKTGMRTHPFLRLGNLAFVDSRNGSRRCLFSLPSKHRALTCENFRDRTQHEQHAVFEAAVDWQFAQKEMNDLNRATAGLVEPCLIRTQAFDRLQLKITARIALVSGARAIRDRWNSARREHLHHQRSARARQSAYDGDEIVTR